MKSKEELDELSMKIRYTGYYPLVTSPQNAEELSVNKEKLERGFPTTHGRNGEVLGEYCRRETQGHRREMLHYAR